MALKVDMEDPLMRKKMMMMTMLEVWVLRQMLLNRSMETMGRL